MSLNKREKLYEFLNKKDVVETDLKKVSTLFLRSIGNEIGLKNIRSLKKGELIIEILKFKRQDTIKLCDTKIKKSVALEKNFDEAFYSLVEIVEKYHISNLDSKVDNNISVEDFAFFRNIKKSLQNNKEEKKYTLNSRFNIENFDKTQLIKNDNSDTKFTCGTLDIISDKYGFLRGKKYSSTKNDVYVPAQQIKIMKMRQGDFVIGQYATNTNRNDFLVYTNYINNIPANQSFNRPYFESLTAMHPMEKLNLTSNNDHTLRSIDLFSPIGKGQRGIIVSPPKAGKTTILKKLAKSILDNNENTKVFVLLIDERPEEVTDFANSVDVEVIASTFDKSPEHHTRVAELVIDSAKRLAETGVDVVILMDSLTRLARAYNSTCVTSGRSLSGGLDSNALQIPKKLFGTARNLENNGSLTILATCLIDTGSKLDDIVYEEFKGTGNMELVLNRNLSEQRIFPAIDVIKSGTRMDHLLMDKNVYELENRLRRLLTGKQYSVQMKIVLEMFNRSKDNIDLGKKFPEWIKLGILKQFK